MKGKSKSFILNYGWIILVAVIVTSLLLSSETFSVYTPVGQTFDERKSNYPYAVVSSAGENWECADSYGSNRAKDPITGECIPCSSVTITSYIQSPSGIHHFEETTTMRDGAGSGCIINQIRWSNFGREDTTIYKENWRVRITIKAGTYSEIYGGVFYIIGDVDKSTCTIRERCIGDKIEQRQTDCSWVVIEDCESHNQICSNGVCITSETDYPEYDDDKVIGGDENQGEQVTLKPTTKDETELTQFFTDNQDFIKVFIVVILSLFVIKKIWDNRR